MAKKPAKQNDSNTQHNSANSLQTTSPGVPAKSDFLSNELDKIADQIPDDAKKRLDEIKDRLDKFKVKLLGKFEGYIMGLALLPPDKEDEKKEKINVLVLVDDTDSQKMTKDELKERLSAAIAKQAEEIDKNLSPQTILLTEVWQSCYDAKYDILQMFAMSAPVYDTGMLAALKIAEIHKTMVLKKFEKYIVSYVLAGSLVQGKATAQSDIDVCIIIDDTDVKKMTRAELKDKLRAIIIGMGIDAGKMTGIENKINIQPWILTDFWEGIKEANPVYFTFLRDGIPLYDRGIFMPWKLLLQMGRIKPSPEAIDMFMNTGDQVLERVKYKLKEIAMEDAFWAVLTPSQAALMMNGIPPPTPKETPDVMEDIFVKKEKILEKEYVTILREIIKTRKDLEHGTKKNVSGLEVDKLLKDAEKYLKRLTELFKDIEKKKEEETFLHTYESTITVARDVLRLEGVLKAKDSEVADLFEKKLVHRGILPDKFLRILVNTIKAKKDYDLKKLNKVEIQAVQKDTRELIRALIEHIQRKRGLELERAKIRVKHGDKYGEVVLLGSKAFITYDIDKEDREIRVANLAPNGALLNIKESSLEEYEKEIANVVIPEKAFIKQKIFEDLKAIFGKDVEILINY